MGDPGGLTMAHGALELALKEQPQPKIDGLTPQQRFFHGWAQIWRRNYTDEALKIQVNVGPHSPGKFRVNGPLSNLSPSAKPSTARTATPCSAPRRRGCRSGSEARTRATQRQDASDSTPSATPNQRLRQRNEPRLADRRPTTDNGLTGRDRPEADLGSCAKICASEQRSSTACEPALRRKCDPGALRQAFQSLQRTPPESEG
ncbi:MAG: hypothetical protein IPH76_04400 [Xanthomonadales bacterium]|nr:hypothetical protein [Xanthomonadales bacterium]